MIGKTPKEHQMSIFEVALESFIDMNHELVLLSKQIDWEAVESEFAEYYCADNIRKQRTSGEILHPCPCWTVARHWVWIRVSGWKMSGYDSLGMGITVGPTANSSLIVGQN